MKKNCITFVLFLTILTINYSCKKEKSNPDGNYKSFMVCKDDKITKDEYFPVGDSALPRDIRSVTKSVISTLVGIAIDKGYIQSEDQKIGDYLRPLNSNIDEAKANIKISDLLSMSSGIDGNDLSNVSEYENWRNAPNQLSYTLAKTVIHMPGEAFMYNSGASHLLSIILTQATGMSTFQFAKENLFQPLNIDDHYWERDKQGNYNGSAGLYLTPHDMLKIGQLYLKKGMYNGVRIVSEEWINKVSSFKITTNNIEPFGPGYGYLWWIGNAHQHNYFFANGYGGQFIVVVPDLNLIVVATNNWSGVGSTVANQKWYNTLDSIINNIIPSFN
jgi:CubicO group peptidase (beta-lactamase class C family)